MKRRAKMRVNAHIPPVILATMSLCANVTLAATAPIFVGEVASSGSETRLNLSDSLSSISLPPVFAGWLCYFDETQRVGRAFTKKITCGGKWGFVDAFASCDSNHRHSFASLRLRQPIADSKGDSDAADKVVITLGCGYPK